jgi:hypothetical protein
MAELEAMKALVASLQENANTKKGEDILRNLLTAILQFVWSMEEVIIIIIICNALHRKRRCRPHDC